MEKTKVKDLGIELKSSLLGTKAFCKAMGISRQTLYNWRAKGFRHEPGTCNKYSVRKGKKFRSEHIRERFYVKDGYCE